MSKYTKLELDILKILAANHPNGEFFTEDPDGKSPHVHTWELTFDGLKQKDSTIWQIYGLDPKVYRGVISSLIKKDAIIVDEYDAGASFEDVLKGAPLSASMVAIGITRKAFFEVLG